MISNYTFQTIGQCHTVWYCNCDGCMTHHKCLIHAVLQAVRTYRRTEKRFVCMQDSVLTSVLGVVFSAEN